jgi:guanylate kinase
MKRKIVIVGRSGCGKDTLAIALTEQFGMKQLCSTTTRPKRYEGEDAHVFVSEEEANRMTDRVAETVINGYQYFATKQQLDECDTYVIDPRGLECLCENAPDVPLCVVYVYANDSIRKHRAMLRAADAEEAARIFDERHLDENHMFTDFEADVFQNGRKAWREKYPNVDVVISLENNYDDKKMLANYAELVKTVADSSVGGTYHW